MMKESNKGAIAILMIAIGILVVSFLAVLQIFSGYKTEKESILRAKEDTLRVWKDSRDRQHAQIMAFVADGVHMRELLKDEKLRSDSLTTALINSISKNSISATVIKNQTQSSHSTPSVIDTTSLKTDSDSTSCQPVYKTEFSGPWEKYEIVAGPDSIRLHHISYNQFSITQDYKKDGSGIKSLLRPKILEVNVVNENPNTETIGLKSWHLPPPKNKFIPGAITGAILTALAILLISK